MSQGLTARERATRDPPRCAAVHLVSGAAAGPGAKQRRAASSCVALRQLRRSGSWLELCSLGTWD